MADTTMFKGEKLLHSKSSSSLVMRRLAVLVEQHVCESMTDIAALSRLLLTLRV